MISYLDGGLTLLVEWLLYFFWEKMVHLTPQKFVSAYGILSYREFDISFYDD